MFVSVVFLGFSCILGDLAVDLYVDEKNPGEGAKWTCRKEIVGVSISEQARAGKINPDDLRQDRGGCTWPEAEKSGRDAGRRVDGMVVGGEVLFQTAYVF